MRKRKRRFVDCIWDCSLIQTFSAIWVVYRTGSGPQIQLNPVQSASEPLHLTCFIFISIHRYYPNYTCSPAEMCNISHWSRRTQYNIIIIMWGVGLHSQTLVSAVDWTVDDGILSYHCHSEKQSKPGVKDLNRQWWNIHHHGITNDGDNKIAAKFCLCTLQMGYASS